MAPLLAASLLGLAACGGGGSDAESTVPADVDLTVVALDGIRWEQTEYTAGAGTVTVALQNNSSLPHNLRVIAADGTANPVVLDAPSRGTVVTNDIELTAGTYTLICTIPGHANMKATLTVS